VKYSLHRDSIQSGHLLAWTHRSWASWYDIQIQLVRTFTQSEYCHVGVAWRAAGRVFVLEAVQTGIRIFPLSRLLPCYWLPIAGKWESEVEAWAMEQVGEPYSKWQCILAGLGLLKPGVDNIWQCAEFAQEVAMRYGVPLACNPTPAAVVNAALAEVDLTLLTKDDR
jgi:hypothetical protein